MKKVLITGANGQLGNSVLQQLYGKYTILATDISHKNSFSDITYQPLDITDSKKVNSTLSNFNPDVIVNLAAFTDVDGCESNPEKAYLLNTKSVEMLTKKFTGQFIQISTDYIFDGTNGPYSEDDIPNPKSVYGKTKLDSEKVLHNSKMAWCIIRTNVLFDYYHSTQASFIKWVVDSLNSKKSIKIVNDQWNNPTWTVKLAEFIDLVIKKNVKGIYNYGGADYLNRLEFAQLIADIFELDKSLISPISTDSLKQIAPRPLRGGLKIDKIKKEFGLEGIKLIDCLEIIKSRLNK